MHAVTAPAAETEAEEIDDEAPPELRLAAALHVHGAALVSASGTLIEEHARDGAMSPWLREDICRTAEHLAAALREYLERPHG